MQIQDGSHFPYGSPPLSPFLAPTSHLLSMTMPQASGGMGIRLPSVPSPTSAPQHHGPSSSYSPASASDPLPRIYQCEECGRAFARNHDLTRHRKSHLGIKPHRCKACNRGFTRGDALRRHAANTGCGSGSDDMGSGSPSSYTPPPEFEMHMGEYSDESLGCYTHQSSASAPPDLC